MNCIKLLSVLVFSSIINSSLPEVTHVVSHSGSATEYSFIQHYSMEDNAIKDPIKDSAKELLLGNKDELIRLWIESTSIYRMNN